MGLKVAYMSDEAIEKDAQALLADYARERGMLIEVPIPIDDIIEKHLKIGIEFDDTHGLFGVPRSGIGLDPDILGAIFFDEKRIVIDESLDPEANPAKEGRYRYTAAHEVGHWRLHRALFWKDPAQVSLLEPNAAPSVVCRSSQAKERIEFQADLYASCLLMPRQAIRRHWISTFNTHEPIVFDEIQSQPWARRPNVIGLRPISEALVGVIEELAKNIGVEIDPSPDYLFNRIAGDFARHFLVSTQAMRIRLERLGFLTTHAPEQHSFSLGA